MFHYLNLVEVNPAISRFLHDRRAIQRRNGLTRMERAFITGFVLMAVTVYLTVG